MEVDCLKIKTEFAKRIISGLVRKFISKKLDIDLTGFLLNDLDVQTNGDFVEIHLDTNIIISKNDLQTLIGGMK